MCGDRETPAAVNLEKLDTRSRFISLVDKKFAGVKNLKEKRKIYTLDSAIKAKRSYVKKHPGSEKLWEQFFELLVFDALIGGTDRHYYNWGVLEKADNGKFLRLAPAFDNEVSFMWKMEEYRTQFMQNIHDKYFLDEQKLCLKNHKEVNTPCLKSLRLSTNLVITKAPVLLKKYCREYVM